MKNQKVIMRFDENCTRSKYGLQRIEGTATPDSIIRLLDIADLDANPREAKVGDVTDEIQESLKTTATLFPFKSKGLLLAANSCVSRERNRYELTFEDGDIEGILDGGHNALALGLHILETALGSEADAALRKIKRWQDLPPIWKQYRDKINEVKADLKFLVPVEIIYPQEGDTGQAEFQNAVLDIARARNNNAQLTEETKANKAGFYDYIKESIDPALKSQIEWKSGDGGRIKVRDLVALAWVALSKLEDDLPGLKDVSPVTIYSSKGACVSAFNKLMESEQTTEQIKGGIRGLKHSGVKSALGLLKDLPRLYDKLYVTFPDAYNKVSPGFGRITSVSAFEPGKNNHGKRDARSLSKPGKTKFYRNICKYDYPDGFIMPLVWALRALINNDSGVVSWKTNPDKFIENHLAKTAEVYLGVIQLANYDPQKIGKSAPSYQLAEDNFENRVANMEVFRQLQKQQ